MLLLLLTLVQAGGSRPSLTASVDHAHVRVGDELTLTVQAKSSSTDALTLMLPGLPGFTMIGSREATQVSFGGGGSSERLTLRELTLRAERPGRLVIGGIAVVQGPWRARTSPIVVMVDSGVLSTAVSPIARALLASAPPPARTDQVSFTLVPSHDTAWPGSQLDVVAAAWFPRSVRNQLARDPLLTLPTPVGAWGYPPDGPVGVATSRLVRGTWMDLYVIHQTLFPLASGRLALPPATLEYALPVTASILTREERYELASDSLVIAVTPLPAEGKPADDRGVVGHGVMLAVALDSGSPRVGEPLQITATVAGTGNVTLWPAPVIAWPASLHAYPGEEDTEIETRDGTIAGTKTVRYLVVPDSSGTVMFPQLRYPYFDPTTRSYAVAAVPPRAISVAPGLGLAASRPNLPLLAPGDLAWAPFLTQGAWPWGWLLILLVPPLAALIAVMIRRSRSLPRAPAPVRPWGTRLGRLERDFQDVLVAYVVDADGRDGDALAAALRAAGLEHAVAGHVVRLRDRLRAVRYGPHAAADQAELAEELTQVLKVLGGEPVGGGPRRHVRV
ncbi:MAG TPA: BatD family protein, partial [Gemmatimonadales bacterium]|nr:BatD family protein [Gemmatimonadales bacterium]